MGVFSNSGAVNFASSNPTVAQGAIDGSVGSGLSAQFGDAIIGGSQPPVNAFTSPSVNQQFTTAAQNQFAVPPIQTPTLNAISSSLASGTNPLQTAAGPLDRRVRLRPKSGATQLYYSGSTAAGNASASGARQQSLLSGLGIPGLASSNPASTTAQIQGSAASGSSGGIGSLLNTIGLGSIGQALGFTGSSGRNGQKQQQTNTLNGLSIGAINSTSGNGAMAGVMSVLSQTNGAIFPYTPSVDIQQQVDYATLDPVHSMQEFHAFTRTKAPIINITGKFSAQNATEASYCFAFIMFCRVVSKMAFGVSINPSPGTPPPILLLDAYGNMLNAVPVIMTNFSISLPDDVDYVPVQNSLTYVPSLFTINISLVVQHTPAELRSFSLDQFRSGALLQSWI